MRKPSMMKPSDGARPSTAASRAVLARCTWTSWMAGSTTSSSTASRPSGAPSRTAFCATSRRTSSANRTYIEESVQLLRLADRAHALFERQKPAEKRRVLNFVFSNCVWKEGLLSAEYRQPFDMLALAPEAPGDQVGEDAAKTASFEKWLPSLNPLRSFSTAGLSLATPQPTG